MKKYFAFLLLLLAMSVYCETATYGFYAVAPATGRVVGASAQRVPGGGWTFSIPALEKGTSLLLESDVPFDIVPPIDSLRFVIATEARDQKPPVVTMAQFTGARGGIFSARLKKSGDVLKLAFEKGREPGTAESPLRLSMLEVWLPPSGVATQFTMKSMTISAAGLTRYFDPSQFIEWDFGGQTVYRRAANLKPHVRLRSLWPETLQVKAALTEEDCSLWTANFSLEREQWKSLDIVASPSKNGICPLRLQVTAPGQRALSLVLNLGIDSYGRDIQKNDAFGINTHFVRLSVDAAKHPEFTRIFRELGSGWIRVGILEEPRFFQIDRNSWKIDQPLIDRYLRVAEAAGVKVSILSNMLGWTETVPRNGELPREPFGDLAEWFRFYHEFARTFKGRIGAYELLNERDNVWRPALYFADAAAKEAAKGNPFAFYTIGEQTAACLAMQQAFKAADPAIPVIAPGPGYISDVAGSHVQLQYNRRMLEQGVGNFVDVSNLHLYGWLHTGMAERDPFDTVDGRGKNLCRVDSLLSPLQPKQVGMVSNSLRQIMYYEAMSKEFQRRGPLWVTEFSQASARPDVYASEMKKSRWIYTPSIERQAADVVIAHAFLFALGAEKVFWFEDTDYSRIDPGFSLYDVRMTPKPSVLSYRLMSQLLNGAKYAGELAVPQTIWGREKWERRPSCFAPVFKLADGRELAIVWSMADTPEVVTLTLPDGAAEMDIFGNPMPPVKGSAHCEIKLGGTPRLLFGSFGALKRPRQPLEASTASTPDWDKSLFAVTPQDVVLARPGEEKELRIDVWSASGKAQTVAFKLSLPAGSGWTIIKSPAPVALPEGQFVRGTAYVRLKAKNTTDEIGDPADLFRRPRLKIEAESSTGRKLVPILQDLAVSALTPKMD